MRRAGYRREPVTFTETPAIGRRATASVPVGLMSPYGIIRPVIIPLIFSGRRRPRLFFCPSSLLSTRTEL